MHLWYFEILIRSLDVLLRATWRRTPPSRWKILRWLPHYLFWVAVILGAVTIAPYRGSLFIAIYAWFRDADDVLDGEDPRQPDDLGEFMSTKSLALERCFSHAVPLYELDGHDRLLVYIRYLIRKIGVEREASEHLRTIWKHMRTDHEWLRTRAILPMKELDAYARSQDTAIFRLAALVLSVPPEACAAWKFDTTGVFTYTDWISDMAYDIRTGMIHISQEECQWFAIDEQALMNGIISHRILRKLAARRLEQLLPLWKQVEDERKACMASFKNPLLGFFYDRFMLRQFSEVMKMQCEDHGVFLPSPVRT